jgi:tetratricopeptide (TPR) repeat protein
VSRSANDEVNSYWVTQALSITANQNLIQDNYGDAARLIHWAVAVNPGNPNYYMTLGSAYVGLGITDSIRAVSEGILKRDPESPQGPFFMGIYYSDLKDMDSALRSFKLAGMRYEAGMAKQKDRLVGILQLKSDAQADQIAARLIALRNSTNGLKSYIVDTLKADKSLREVAEVANNLFIDQLQAGSSFLKAGFAAAQQGDASPDSSPAQRQYFFLADTMMKHASTQDPSNYDALWYDGYANYRLDLDTGCIAAFRKAIVLSQGRGDMVAAKDHEVWFFLGTSEARLEQYDSAVVHFHLAIKADPTFGDAYTNLALVFKDMSGDNTSSPFTDSALKALSAKDTTGWFITVWSETTQSEMGQAKPASGMVFAVVNLSIFNKTNNTATVEPAKLMLTCDDKKSYPGDLQADAAPDLNGQGLKAGPLEANQKQEAFAFFAIPKGAKPIALTYQPSTGAAVSVPVK